MDRLRGSTEGTQRRTKARTEPCDATEGRLGADRLSALSDELLLHILSFLEIREAISISRLSRRWRYRYHHLPCLNFSSEQLDQECAWFIDRVLLLHAAPRIEVFRLVVWGDVEDSMHRRIDSWLLFAVRRGVRVLSLQIDVEGPYEVSPSVFHCRTLEQLSVDSGFLSLPEHVRLVSLKKMCLRLIELTHNELECLLLGCPLLQSLKLEAYNDKEDVVINARESRNLEELAIVEGFCGGNPGHPASKMQICAPSVKYLRFEGAPLRRHYEARDLSSVAVASFQLDRDKFFYGDPVFYQDKVDMFTTDLFLRIHQVQVLKLCCWSLQALSRRELQGNLVSAFSGVTRLELTIPLEQPQLQAISSALRACSKLGTLVLSIRPYEQTNAIYYNGVPDETESPRLLVPDSNIVMQDLKTIMMIHCLARYDHIPDEEEDSNIGELVAAQNANNVVLIGFLLKVSPALEKLVVQPDKVMNVMARKWELLFKLSSDLLSLPRASPNAQVIIEGGMKQEG